MQPVVGQRVGGVTGEVGHVGGDVEQLGRRKLDANVPAMVAPTSSTRSNTRDSAAPSGLGPSQKRNRARAVVAAQPPDGTPTTADTSWAAENAPITAVAD